MGPADQEAWTAHLSVCMDCRREEARERRLQALFQAIPAATLAEPPDLQERIRITVPQRLQQRYRQRLLAWGTALALVTLLVGTTLKTWLLPAREGNSYQRLARQAQREFFWTNQLQPTSSYGQIEKAAFSELFFDYILSGTQRRYYQEAVHRLQRRIHHQPYQAQNWMLLGTLQLGLNKTQSGRKALERALDLNPAMAGVYQQISEIYRREGRFAEALRAANQAIEWAPQAAFPYCQRAAVRAGQHDYQGALQDLRQAEVREPGVPETSLARGMVLLEIGRLQEAADAFRQASNYDPSYHRARVLLGMVYSYQGYPEMAITIAQQVLKEEPDYPLACFLLGAVYEDMGKPEAAITAYWRFLENNPGQDYVAYRLGRQYAILDRPQAAQAAFGALVKKAPRAYMLHLQLGLAYQRQGRFPEAIREIRTAWQQQPQTAYPPLFLASAFHAAGQTEQALATLLQVAQHFPEEPQVGELLFRFLRETPRDPGPVYGEARATLLEQRGLRTQRFLATVARLAQEKGVWKSAQPLWDQAQRFLEGGDVIRAEQQGAVVCDRYDLGASVTLGPTNRDSGLRQIDLPNRDGGTRAVADLGGLSARWTQTNKVQNRIYFDVAEERASFPEVWVLVNYWDAPENGFQITYDSTEKAPWQGGNYKGTENVWKGNTRTWQCYVFWLPDAAFRGRQHEGADFCLFSRGWRDTAFHSVRVLMSPAREQKALKGREERRGG